MIRIQQLKLPVTHTQEELEQKIRKTLKIGKHDLQEIERFFPHLVEIDVLKLYNIFKIYLPRGIFIWTNLLSYLTQPMN